MLHVITTHSDIGVSISSFCMARAFLCHAKREVSDEF
jgi:hypothetical protein